jgi:beta-lactamase class A
MQDKVLKLIAFMAKMDSREIGLERKITYRQRKES